MGVTGRERLALIALGGPPGAGKTTLARRLSSELAIPRLGSDDIGRLIEQSGGLGPGAANANAFRIGYDVLFGLCEEFLRSGVSTLVDTNLGWAFQWQRLDALAARYPDTLILPIVLRCPRAVCLERIARRHAADPTHGPPALFRTEPTILRVYEFIERLDRPDIHFVDAAGSRDGVYEEVRRYLRAVRR